MKAISTQNLCKTYFPAQGPEITALNQIDLSIDTGEIYALLGPNGAGKTTLISILTTLLLPTAGQAHVAGFDVVDAPAEVRRRIGVTFQETVLDLHLTGRQSLHFHGRLYGLGDREIKTNIQELAGLVQLEDALDRKVNGYSGGMKRRLELIRGLLTKPQILFLDEPTQGLDPQNRLAIWEYLARLRQQSSLTILLTTHYMEEAETLADRVGIIDHGQLVQQGTPTELSARLGQDVIVLHGTGNAERLLAMLGDVEWAQRVTRHALPSAVQAQQPTAETASPDIQTLVQVGVDHGASRLSTLVGIATQADFQIQELTVNRPTLADVFLASTGSSLSRE